MSSCTSQSLMRKIYYHLLLSLRNYIMFKTTVWNQNLGHNILNNVNSGHLSMHYQMCYKLESNKTLQDKNCFYFNEKSNYMYIYWLQIETEYHSVLAFHLMIWVCLFNHGTTAYSSIKCSEMPKNIYSFVQALTLFSIRYYFYQCHQHLNSNKAILRFNLV